MVRYLASLLFPPLPWVSRTNTDFLPSFLLGAVHFAQQRTIAIRTILLVVLEGWPWNMNGGSTV